MRHTSVGGIRGPAGSRATFRRSFQVLNALDQIEVLRTVFIPHWLHRRLEWSLVVDLDDLDARCLDLLGRLLFHRIPKLALILLRFLGKLRDQRLVRLENGPAQEGDGVEWTQVQAPNANRSLPT